MVWSVVGPVTGAASLAAPVVSVGRPCIYIRALHFATTSTGSTDFYYVYLNSNSHSHPLMPATRDLHWWARGSKITDPEWEHGRPQNENHRACFTRNRPVAVRVKLVSSTTSSLSGTLSITPTLDRSTSHIGAASTSFTYPAGASEHWVTITFSGNMPNEVGRFLLRLRCNMTGSGFRFCGPRNIRLRIYGVYGQPLDPAYDSASSTDTGSPTSQSDGTLTGSRKRLDHMMRAIGGSNRRCRVQTVDDLVSLYWSLHLSINNRNPPWFDGAHNQYITVDGNNHSDSSFDIPLEDQWLALARSEPFRNPDGSLKPNKQRYWNDASCIGHAQLAKTMLASVGLFARRVWVFPQTTRLPPGAAARDITIADGNMYCLGNYSTAGKTQTWTFTVSSAFGSTPVTARPKLIEPDGGWENFEACMLSPTGKFLTGGYHTSSNPASFRSNKGFNSAAELLRWWCRTRRGSFRRFVCWGAKVGSTFHYWDVDGNHYDSSNFEQIRNTGKDLPIP